MIQSEEEIKEAIRHRDVLLDIRAVLGTDYGKRFVKYLFDTLSVGDLPELGLEGTFLHDKLGYLRSGRAVFKIVSEANPEVAGQIVAELEKEAYERSRQKT